MNINRKTSAPIHIPHALLSIVGGIQPGPLRESLGKCANAENGLLSRFILVEPPDRVRHWTPGDDDADPDDPGDDAMSLWARRLAELNPDEEGEPIELTITREAGVVFKRFADTLEDRRHAESSEPLKAALSKARAIGARLALLCELATWASQTPDTNEEPAPSSVGVDAMRAGCELAEWCVAETLRVYGCTLFGMDQGKRSALATLDRCRQMGSPVRARDLQRNHRTHYRTTADANAALDDLVARGWATVHESPRSKRGVRPTK